MAYQIRKWVGIAGGSILVLVAAVVLVNTASTEPKAMPVAEFGRHVRALRSIANEIVLFSALLDQVKLTDSYAKVHCEKLQEEVRSTARQLEDPVLPELAGSGARVRVIAEALSSKLQELRRHRTDSKEIQKIKQQANRLEQELSNLGAAL
jgi:hypothetical protein